MVFWRKGGIEIMLENSNRAQLGPFLDALTIDPAIHTWRYDADGTLLESNSAYSTPHRLFEHTGGLSEALAYGKEHSAPFMFSAPMGLVWCAVFDKTEDILQEMYVLGPVFFSDSGAPEMEETLRNLTLDYYSRKHIIQLIRDVPVFPSATYFHLCLMLHYSLTGERLSKPDIYQKTVPPAENRGTPVRTDRLRVWRAETALLQMVRDGDINYRSAMERAANLSDGVRIRTSDPIQHAIVSCTTFVGLCTRASIEGGLIPDEAYSLGDSYIQQMLSCKTMSELRALNHAMYEDFILHVHRLKQDPRISGMIHGVIDYIETHLEEDLQTETIAAHFGYVRSYLSRRFHEETGRKLSEYVRIARVEQAKKLLLSTDMPIREIAQMLRFSSSSHFSNTFREITGTLPAAYRKENSPESAG